MMVEHFNINIVREGEEYGQFDTLLHTESDPLVEFYDSRVPKAGPLDQFETGKYLCAAFFPSGGAAVRGPLGQFVARYYLTTLLASSGGLNLQGGIPAWRISAEGMDEVRNYLRTLT